MSLDKKIEKIKDENKVNLEITVKQTKSSWVKQALVTAGITVLGMFASAYAVFKVLEPKIEKTINYKIESIEKKFDSKVSDLEKTFKEFFYDGLEELPDMVRKELKKEYDQFWEKYDNDQNFREEINKKFWDRLNNLAKDYEHEENN